MCDRIALMNNGQIVLEGEPETLKKNYWDHTKIVVLSDKPVEFTSIQGVEIKDNYVEIKTNDVKKTLINLMDIAKDKNIKITDIKTSKPSLEEIFMMRVKNAR